MSVSDAALEKTAGEGESKTSNKNTKLSKRELNRDDTQFRISSFVSERGTGEEMRDRSGGQRKERNPWTDLSRDTRDKYRRFMTDHIKDRLSKVKKDAPELMDDLDREVYGILAGKTDTGALKVEFEDADINDLEKSVDEFLNSPRGYVITDIMMGRQTEVDSSALGLIPETNPGPTEDIGTEPRDQTPLGMREGPLGYPARKAQEFLSEPTASYDGRKGEVAILGSIRLPNVPIVPAIGSKKIGPLSIPYPYLSRFNDQNRLQTGVLLVGAGAALAGGLGVATLGMAPALAAATLGFAPTAAEAIALAVGKGVSRDYKKPDSHESKKALEYIKSSPDRIKYVRLMSGINVLNPSPGASEANQKQLRHDIDARIKARMEFMKDIHADRAGADALAIGFLYNSDGRKGYPEKTAVRYMEEIAEKFNADEDGIRDTLGRTRKVFDDATNSWINNPAFLTGLATLDYHGNRERFEKARLDVAMDQLKKYIIEQKKTSLPGASRWEEKIKARDKSKGEEATVYKARVKDFETNRDLYKRDRGSIDAGKTTIEEYNKGRKAIEEIRTRATKEVVRNFAGRFTSIEGAMSGLDDVINGIGTEVIINGDRIKSTKQRNLELETWQEEQYEEIAGRVIKRTDEEAEHFSERLRLARENIDSEVARKAAKIQEDVNKVLTEKNRLQEVLDKIDEQRVNLKEEGSRFTEIKTTTEGYTKAYRELRAIGLSDAQLRTNDIDQIMDLVNVLPAGWKKEQNDKDDIRNKVINAMIEARGRRIESSTPRKADLESNFKKLTDEPTWALTDEELRTMSFAEIKAMLDKRAPVLGTPPPPVPSDSEINDAVKFAMIKFDSRAQAGERLEKEFDGKIKIQEDEIGKVDLSGEIKQIEVTSDLLKNFDRIMDRRYEIFEKKDEFTKNTKINPTDPDYTTYTPSERDVTFRDPPEKPPRGYYEFLDVMLKYKDRNDREEYFKKVSSIITPDRLMEIMNEPLFGTPFSPLITPNFETFLDILKDQMDTGDVKVTEMENALLAVIDRFKDEGEAL